MYIGSSVQGNLRYDVLDLFNENNPKSLNPISYGILCFERDKNNIFGIDLRLFLIPYRESMLTLKEGSFNK